MSMLEGSGPTFFIPAEFAQVMGEEFILHCATCPECKTAAYVDPIGTMLAFAQNRLNEILLQYAKGELAHKFKVDPKTLPHPSQN